MKRVGELINTRSCFLWEIKIVSMVVLFFLVYLATVQAQTITGPAVSCLDFELYIFPNSDLDEILDSHFNRSTADDENWACWVHVHPNGIDYVVTPYAWEQTPSARNVQIINESFQGLDRARAAYSSLGGHFDRSMYLIVSDGYRADPEATVLNLRCWIQLGALDWRGDRASYVKQIIAHEAGHCFISENVANFRRSELNGWWDEGAAEYLSTLAYPDLDAEHDYSSRYDLDGNDFRQEYQSFLFFDFYEHEFSKRAVLLLLNRLYSIRVRGSLTSEDQIEAAVKEQRSEELRLFKLNGWDEVFHDFTVKHFQSKMPDAGGGFYPRENTVATLYTYTLEEEGDELSFDAISEARLNKISLIIPQSSSVRFYPLNSESESAYATIIEDGRAYKLNGSRTIRSACNEASEITLILTHFEDLPLEDIKIPYLLQTDDSCQEDEAVASVPSPSGPSGGSYGDPHFYTFDKLGYSLQAVGEFVLVQATNPADEFKVQVRHHPVGATVSLTSAVAARVGSDVLNFHMEHKDEINLNGKWQTLEADGILDLATGSLTRTVKDYDLRSYYTVTWHDGTVLSLKVSANAIDTNVSLAAGRVGQVQGLLGDADGKTVNDLTGRDGTIYPEAPAFEQLYHGFGESWRINDSESLFSYNPGETTATFTDRNFPLQPVRLADIPAETLAKARANCEAAGVKDSFALNNCALDIAVTGDAAFAVSAMSAGTVTDHVITPEALTDKGQYVLMLEQSDGIITFRSDDDPEANVLALTDPSKGDGYVLILNHPDLSVLFSTEEGANSLILTRPSVQMDRYLETEDVELRLTRILHPEPKFLAGSIWGSLQAVFVLSDGSELTLTLTGLGAQLQDLSRLFGN